MSRKNKHRSNPPVAAQAAASTANGRLAKAHNTRDASQAGAEAMYHETRADVDQSEQVASAAQSVGIRQPLAIIDVLAAAGGGEGDQTGRPLMRADRMLESLRYAEYDIMHGIGELVDNSVESGARNIWVTHTREPLTVGKKNFEVVSQIAVIDDGEGMASDVLGRSLVLGESPRPRRGNELGIGRFGVGMTLGALSLAREISVYSRNDVAEGFRYTVLDLDAVNRGDQTAIPEPVIADPPAEFAALLRKSTGTIVVLKKCDRLQHSQVNQDKPIPADEQVAGLAHWLGRTYRKFIAAGLSIKLDEQRVYLHDPLYISGPTFFDNKGKTDPKATSLGTKHIELDVPGTEGKKAKVSITMSLLPREFRQYRFHGNKGIAKERRIDENEGISVMRADREVLYGVVPYITPKVGVRGKIEIDRFWGCEISFPPELDSYFTVRYIKRGAEPVPALKKMIKDMIWPTVQDLRKQISAEFDQDAAEAEAERTAFTAAEDALAAADKTLPRGRRGTNVTREEEEATITEIASESVEVAEAPPEERRERQTVEKKRIAERPYSIVSVRYPANIFFETVHLFNRVVVKLNTNHLFYTTVFEPLCGSVDNMNEDSDVELGTTTPEQRRARDAFMLLILSYARAEAMFGDAEMEGETAESLFESLRTQWGLTLGAAISKAGEG